MLKAMRLIIMTEYIEFQELISMLSTCDNTTKNKIEDAINGTSVSPLSNTLDIGFAFKDLLKSRTKKIKH